MTEQQAAADAPRATENRSTVPKNERFIDYIGSNWAPRPDIRPAPREVAPLAAERRAAIGAKFPGHRLVIGAGPARARSNDTDYAYRAHSAFAHLTGWGSDAVPDSVLVLEPVRAEMHLEATHEATLYFRESAGRDSDEFYANPEIGEFWVGPRPSLLDVAAELEVTTASLRGLPAFDDEVPTRTLDDADLARELSELRLVKDEYEVAQMREAIRVTKLGFDDIIADLPAAIAHDRGERVVEGVFNARARLDGNAVGYDTIAASARTPASSTGRGTTARSSRATSSSSTPGSSSTRTTRPTSPGRSRCRGTFTPEQRLVYETVREAADAAFAVAKPGVVFRDIHAAAMEVIARRTAEWGILTVTAEEALDPEHQEHRRYMVHGTSHHLGLDVHDCAQARREMYHDGVLRPGMVFTIEPGLYFQPDDLTVPERFRGIGVRIEDNVLVTETGLEHLSAGIPRTADEVEAWLAAR